MASTKTKGIRLDDNGHLRINDVIQTVGLEVVGTGVLVTVTDGEGGDCLLFGFSTVGVTIGSDVG